MLPFPCRMRHYIRSSADHRRRVVTPAPSPPSPVTEHSPSSVGQASVIDQRRPPNTLIIHDKNPLIDNSYTHVRSQKHQTHPAHLHSPLNGRISSAANSPSVIINRSPSLSPSASTATSMTSEVALAARRRQFVRANTCTMQVNNRNLAVVLVALVMIVGSGLVFSCYYRFRP